MFEYYICYKILLYFPSFALSVTLTGQFRLQLNSSFRLALLFVSSTSLPCLRRLVVGLSPRSPGDHVGFVVDTWLL